MKRLLIIGALLLGATTVFGSYHTLFRRCAPMTVTIVNKSQKRLGTGVLIDPTHVLTVGHLEVKENDDLIVMSYPDKFSTHAIPLAVDHLVDLAVLTLDHDLVDTEVATLAHKNAEIGDNVLIIGNGAGFLWTATQGIVSGTNRLHEKFGQTDAVVNPGNSGGPVFDMNGHVVGIVDAKVTDPFGGIDGIGFYIPVDQINAFLARYTLK